ncbi:MAG: bifunctional adenosylcobinamide kinase/adenosylcobinamide-phosphate guanylyltransferase [Candidatus Edwardsbacteria bacterium]
MDGKIIFVLGGARSGKSSFAMAEALKINGRKAYIATAEALDEEMKQRIERHKIARGPGWDTYEEPLEIAEVIKKIEGKYRAIVIDCLTLWLSNLMCRTQNKEQRAQTMETDIQRFLDKLKMFRDDSSCTLISGFRILFIVSNEVGMGIVPENEFARKFRDTAGFLNQKIAEIADEVYFVTAGIPLRIK